MSERDRCGLHQADGLKDRNGSTWYVAIRLECAGSGHSPAEC